MIDLSKYIRYYGTLERLQKLLDSGRCPVCELRLESAYHTDCSYLDDLAKDMHTTDLTKS